ncbi:hypothetical protein HUU05_19400 [candidate division KSB1 bacterium]|nr:hypothetical protein [candidate division KSB1 bacterium]
MSTLKACQKLPQAEREVWEGGIIKLRSWVMDEKQQPIRPAMAICLDLQSGTIIGHELTSKPLAPKNFLKQILAVMAKPQIGPPRRPTHLCLQDAALAEHLREPLASLGVTVEVIDRFIALDKVMDMVMESIRAEDSSESFPGLLSIGGVTHEYAEHFFQVAAQFHRHAPWQYISDYTPLQVECPHFFRSPLYFVVMGNAGMEYGLGLFPNLEEIVMLYAVGIPKGEELPDVRTASLLFSDPTFVSFEDLDAIEQHGWEIAAPHAYPHLFKLSPKRKPPMRAPSFAMVQVFEAGLLALPDFLSKHKTKIKTGKVCAAEITIETFHGPWPVHITVPPPEPPF